MKRMMKKSIVKLKNTEGSILTGEKIDLVNLEEKEKVFHLHRH